MWRWSKEVAKADHSRKRLEDVRGFIGGVYGPELHAKRVDALAGATVGVMTGASLAVAMIGQALAQARGLVTKHAVKQVDRLMSNQGIDVWDSFARWVPQQVGARPDILVAMDWTDFDRDGQSTLVLSLVTGHGRAAPLIWLTVWKEEIATRRNDYEDRLLLVSAFAMALLTLLGTVGESLGMDRLLKSNTSKTRTHSLFRQGCMLYELIPNKPEHRLAPLIAAFAKAVSNASEFTGLFT